MADQKAHVITGRDERRPDEKEHPRDRTAQLLLDTIIPYQMNRLSHRMNWLLDQELRTHGLSISSWRIMAVLDYNAATTVNDLALYAMIEQSTLSRMLKRMEEDGLLKRDRMPGDGRARSISLTENGRRRFEAVRAVAMKHVGRIVHGLSRAERYQLMNFISRMQNNVETLKVEGNRENGTAS